MFCPQSKIIYWKKRYEESCIDGLRTMQRSGIPGSLDLLLILQIKIELSSKDHWKSSQISNLILEISGIT